MGGQLLREGAPVEARHLASSGEVMLWQTRWFHGRISKVHSQPPARADVAFDDGDFEADVLAKFIRPR